MCSNNLQICENDDRFAIIDDHVYFPGDFFCTSSSSPMGERRWPKPSRLYVAEDCAGLAPLVECCKNLGLDFKVWGLQPKNKTTLTNNLCCEDGWIESRALLHVRVRRSPAKAFEGLVQSGDDVEGLFEAQRHLVLETSQDDYTRHKIPMWHNYSIVIITIIVPFNSKIVYTIEIELNNSLYNFFEPSSCLEVVLLWIAPEVFAALFISLDLDFLVSHTRPLAEKKVLRTTEPGWPKQYPVCIWQFLS